MKLLRWRGASPAPNPPDRPQSPLASEEDVYFCFRLLLGRAPGAKEWHGHRLTAGSRLDDIVAKFLASPEFRSRKLRVASLDVSEHEFVSAQGVKLYISAEDKVCGSLRSSGEYEPGVTDLLRRLLKPGMNFVDIGANIGFFSLIASKIVGDRGRVFAVEPYPYNVKMLLANLALNGCNNVEVLPFAASRESHLYRYDDSAGNSGQIFRTGGDAAGLLEQCLVYAMPLDRLIPKAIAVDVIKMDIEGAEFLARHGMQRICSEDRPIVISEVAADFLRDVSKVSLRDFLGSLLIDETYRLAIVHADGPVERHGRNLEAVEAAYARSPAMCLDIVAYPADRDATFGP